MISEGARAGHLSARWWVPQNPSYVRALQRATGSYRVALRAGLRWRGAGPGKCPGGVLRYDGTPAGRGSRGDDPEGLGRPALELEGKPLDEAVQEADRSWSGCLAEGHMHAIELLTTERDTLRQAMAGHLTPEQLADYLEITQDQLLEPVRPNAAKRPDIAPPKG